MEPNDMGTFRVKVRIENHVHRDRSAEIDRLLVDTGSEFTWIAGETLRLLGVAPEKHAVEFQMAYGQTVSREVGFAILRYGEHFTIDEVVFGEPSDMQLLGARTLEGLNLRVDSRAKRLVAAGPLPAA